MVDPPRWHQQGRRGPPWVIFVQRQSHGCSWLDIFGNAAAQVFVRQAAGSGDVVSLGRLRRMSSTEVACPAMAFRTTAAAVSKRSDGTVQPLAKS